MTSEDYARIGRSVKANTGRWHDQPDEVVGKLAIKHGLASPPSTMNRAQAEQAGFQALLRNFPKPPKWFVEGNTENVRKQRDNFSARAAYQIANVDHIKQLENINHSLHHNYTHLEQQDAETAFRHESLLKSLEAEAVTHESRAYLTQVAASKGMDLMTYAQYMLDNAKTQNEILRAQEISRISIEDVRQKEQIRVKAYQDEVEVDARMAVGMDMMPVERYIYVVKRIAQLKRENASDDELAALEEFRVQMARHLLTGAEAKNLETTDDANDSPSGN